MEVRLTDWLNHEVEAGEGGWVGSVTMTQQYLDQFVIKPAPKVYLYGVLVQTNLMAQFQ